jgi:hypothetical protein
MKTLIIIAILFAIYLIREIYIYIKYKSCKFPELEDMILYPKTHEIIKVSEEKGKFHVQIYDENSDCHYLTYNKTKDSYGRDKYNFAISLDINDASIFDTFEECHTILYIYLNQKTTSNTIKNGIKKILQ